jgi:hypothetical protein
LIWDNIPSGASISIGEIGMPVVKTYKDLDTTRLGPRMKIWVFHDVVFMEVMKLSPASKVLTYFNNI